MGLFIYITTFFISVISICFQETTPFLSSFKRQIINKQIIKKWYSTPKIFSSIKMNANEIKEEQNYMNSWYVIGHKSVFSEKGKIKKITVWNKNYAVYRNDEDKYICLDDVCSHKSASLSLGTIYDNCVSCPYHAFRFNENGTLVEIPGVSNFTHSKTQDIQKYNILELNDWVYLNTYYIANETIRNIVMQKPPQIFVEEEIPNNLSYVHIHLDYDNNARLVTENILDIMHISVVHSFGNTRKPVPLTQTKLEIMDDVPHHHKITYLYETGDNSIFKKLYNSSVLKIENEFVLPHTTITRVEFNGKIKTIITHALPITESKTRLFAKVYRNFLETNIIEKTIVDFIFEKILYHITLEDKAIVESIDMRYMDGKFNIKYDALPQKYITLYKRHIRPLIGPYHW